MIYLFFPLVGNEAKVIFSHSLHLKIHAAATEVRISEEEDP